MDKKPTKEIHVIKYMGRTGGFDSKDSVRYRVELVGVKGQFLVLTDNWGTYKERAERIAKDWVELVGWPIVYLEEVKSVSVTTSYKVLSDGNQGL